MIIQRYPNYQDGKVFSIAYKRFLKPQKNKSGYLFVTLCGNGKKKNKYIHQIVARAFIPNPDNKKFVNHKNLQKDDNDVSNLEWVTHSENIIHYYKNKNE